MRDHNIAVENMKRVFKYNNMKLEDPDVKMTVEEVKQFYSNVYPEITQSVTEGPEYKGKEMVYSFTRAVGTKGSGLKIVKSLTLKRLAEEGFEGYLNKPETLEKEGQCYSQKDYDTIHQILAWKGAPFFPESLSLPPLP